ncbi:putative MICOS complex subunit Mic10 protein [Helianthus annuus]|nr:putative MICOS complex subunit Mic10 protein [Helianthus annuus]
MSKNKEIPPPQYDLNAKWDACLDLGVRRFFYSSATGAFAGLLFFQVEARLVIHNPRPGKRNGSGRVMGQNGFRSKRVN